MLHLGFGRIFPTFSESSWPLELVYRSDLFGVAKDRFWFGDNIFMCVDEHELVLYLGITADGYLSRRLAWALFFREMASSISSRTIYSNTP